MISNARTGIVVRTLAAAGSAILGLAIVPICAQSAEKTFTLKVEDKTIDIGAGMTYAASTYDGTVPGPLIRVTQGDEVTIHLINRTTMAHGISS